MNLSQLPFFGRLKLTDKDGNLIPGSENLGAYLKEALSSVARQVTNIETQGGFSASKPVAPPPNIQSLNVTAQNGHFQIAIQDQSTGVGRASQYFFEHAGNPSFTDAHVVPMGQSRNAHIFLGNVTRYFRGYSALPASGPSAHVYHGGAQSPIAVTGGGSVGPPAFLASQGSGTSAPGQAGYGPGPVPYLSDNSGFDRTLQQARGSQQSGGGGIVTPSGGGISPSGGGGGGGGGAPVPPAGATVLGTNSGGGFIAAALAAAKVWIGSVGNLPVAQSISGDATLAAGGGLTLDTVNTDVGSYTLADITVNAKGLVTAAANGSISTTGTFSPTLSFSIGNTGLMYTSSGSYILRADGVYEISITITLSAIGTASGNAVVGALPANIGTVYASQFTNIGGMALLTVPVVVGVGGQPELALSQTGATGNAALTASNFTNSSQLDIGLIFHP